MKKKIQIMDPTSYNIVDSKFLMTLDVEKEEKYFESHGRIVYLKEISKTPISFQLFANVILIKAEPREIL